MKFAELDAGGGHLIQGYAPGRIIIGDRAYTEGLIVSPTRIVPGWGPASAPDLRTGHLQPLIELDPQVIVLGTGKQQIFPDPQVCVPALRQGLGVEVMDTGAACRTYNILISEGRKVVAGLMVY